MPEIIDLPEKHISSAYGIMTLESKHRLVRRLKKVYTPSVHGHKTWSSSYLLMDYLLHHRLPGDKQPVMELGCGWGPASIFCATKGARVTGLDMDEEVFPFLEVQAALNDVAIESKVGGFEGLRKKDLAAFEVLVGADICFWDELRDIHFKLIKRAMAAGVKDIIYADPGRAPFFELAERCSKSFKTHYCHWYAAEPERFEGYILHIRRD